MKRLIISEDEKKHILSLHQNLNIKGILQEELQNIYTTENDQKIYFGENTSYDYVDIKKGTKFTRVQGGSTAFGGGLEFKCSRVGTVKFKNGGTGNKHFTYNKKTYWSNALQKKLISVFCDSIYTNKKSCKGNCENGYGTMTIDNGTVIIGNFKYGQVNGYATETQQNGIKFKGNFKNGIRNGYGTETQQDGTKFKGNFKNGKRNGYGTKTYSDGTFWWGEFNMDEVTDQTYYKNIKGCYFKGKRRRTSDEHWSLSDKSSRDMDEMPCTPGKWIDLENPQTPVGSNAGSDTGNPSGEVGSGSVLGCTQYNDCSSKDGSTTKFVKCDTCSEISRLQACLKDANGNILKTDSKWGKNTEGALNLLNYNGTDGITSEIITTICNNFNQPQS